MQDYGITADPNSLYVNGQGQIRIGNIGREKKKMPTIGSWYKTLVKKAEENTDENYTFHYSYLRKVMKQYVRELNGQMAYFDGQSTFDLLEGVPFINLDISQLEERFARPLAQQILLSWIWEKFVKKNSEDRAKATKKRVLVDEAWMLLPFPEAVDFLNKMARRARKRNVSLAIVSQRFQDFYEKPEAQAVLTSSDTKLFLAQDKSEIQYLKEVFKLSEGEAGFLITCNRGEGLLKVGGDSAILAIQPTKKRVLVDEAWMLLPFPEAVDFLNKMARRARKRNVSLAIVSQRFQDFYEKPEAQAVLTSSDTKLFLAQDKSEIGYLKEVFKLSEGEANFLVTCTIGEGLFKVGSDTAILQITPTRKEFEFMETNLNKLAENN